MRLVLSIVLSLFLVGCFSQDIEKVGKDIVNSLNNEDYDRLWDNYIDDDTKAEMDSDLEEVMEERVVGVLMLSMMGVPEDKMENLTTKELFGYIMSFVNPANDPDADAESILIYESVELIDENNAVILLANDMSDSALGTLELIKINDRWYFNMNDDESDAVDAVEVEETVEDIEVK